MNNEEDRVKQAAVIGVNPVCFNRNDVKFSGDVLFLFRPACVCSPVKHADAPHVTSALFFLFYFFLKWIL